MARITGCIGKYVAVLVLSIMIFGSGCASPMALSKGDKKLDLSKNSIAIISVKVSNQNIPSYQPSVYVMSLGRPKKFNDYKYFKIKSAFAKEKDKYNEYLISIAMPAGNYLIKDVYGESSKLLPPIAAVSLMPVYLPFELKPNEITYLGRIEGTIRKRQNDNEIRAGFFTPLIDQAVAGFSSGTYDITITDSYDADIQHFTQEYPVLKNYTVNKSLLPSWKQPERHDILQRPIGGR
jgi:hypothetical protein